MFDKILIANRGEIALRIHRACKEMGISTVAVHSEADTSAMHVRLADESVCIGPAPASKSYLNIPSIIAACEITGAQAVHPGYGFLSENARFAEIVAAHGYTFIGPKPEHIRVMGDKIAAKAAVKAAGIPVVPGSEGALQTEAEAFAAAEEIGFPVLIKAAAGGGGRGMKVARTREDLAEAVATAKGEAKAAFGDDAVYMERYLSTPRHIELQIIADAFGNVCHLGERDCSLQRRHQKVLEEAPSPAIDAPTRARIGKVVVDAIKAIGYLGVGTIEFLYENGEFFFIEMNTRLQVEHPVTEAITGQDLVEWQLRVASGEALPLTQDQLKIDGHAIEARLYAEDPATGFLPSTGPLTYFRMPSEVRVDAGVEQGGEISPFYDPMIAKLIAHGATRDEAAHRLAQACREVEVWPVKANAYFLANCASHPDFLAAMLDTDFINARLESLIAKPTPSVPAAAVAALGRLESQAAGEACSPWVSDVGTVGFRLNRPARSTATVFVDGSPAEAAIDPMASGGVDLGGPGEAVLFADGTAFSLTLRPKAGAHAGAESDGSIRSPMPGKIVTLAAQVGASVARGAPLVTLEAMKMEHALTAPFDGTVAEVAVKVGDQVSEGVTLIRLEPA
ncbi:MAG TPA: acetyl-CoA carboxylase biotin carboxylase subunit [Caulobacteraceae bacterium]